jgi:hypothetical protein
MGFDGDQPPYPPVANAEAEKPSILEIESDDTGAKNQ